MRHEDIDALSSQLALRGPNTGADGFSVVTNSNKVAYARLKDAIQADEVYHLMSDSNGKTVVSGIMMRKGELWDIVGGMETLTALINP